MPDSVPPLKSWLQRHRRGLRYAALALAGLYLLYLLAANVFLNTQIGATTINRKPQRFTAQWDWAMSLYPGHIYAREVRLRGRVRTVEWQVSGSSAHGRIKLLPLLRRTLQFGPIRGGTVTADVDTDRPMMPPTPRIGAAAQRKPWELVFDGIRTDDLRRARLDGWSLEGQGDGLFEFYKQIAGGPMEIPDAQFRMANATLKQGDAMWARDAAFQLRFSIARHVPSRVPGLQKLRLTDASLKLSGAGPGLVLQEEKDGRLKLRRAGDGGKIRADLALERGALKPGGELVTSMPLIIDGAKSGQQQYPVEARLAVEQKATHLRVRIPPSGARGNFIDADLRLAGRELQPRKIEAMLGDAQGRVRLQWHFGSLAWLNPLLSRGWLRMDGAADVLADLRVVDGTIADGSTASIPDAQLRADVQQTVIAGQASAKAKVQSGRASVDIEAHEFSITEAGVRSDPYVRGNDLRLQLDSSSQLTRFRDELQARLQFERARIPDLRAYNRMLPAGSIKLLGGNGTLDGDLQLDPQGKPVRAKLALAGSGAALQMGVSRITGDLRLDSALHRVSGSDYTLDRLRLGLANVRLASSDSVGPWWGEAEMDGARFGWQAPLHLRGTARLRLKDVGMLLALFAERSAFPKWIGRLIDEGEVEATSGVRVDGDSVVLDELVAHNDRIDLRARLRMAGDKPTGDLYARWGVLGVGVQLQDGKRALKLVGAKRWYDSRPPLPR